MKLVKKTDEAFYSKLLQRSLKIRRSPPPSSGQNVLFQLLKSGRKGDSKVQENNRHVAQGRIP